MPQPSTIAAAASSSSSRPSLHRPVKLTTSGSFHAGAPLPSFSHSSFPHGLGGPGRRHSTHRYHTFPTQPPKTPSETPDSADGLLRNAHSDNNNHSNNNNNNDDRITPLPIRQLALLAFLSLCEQTALNSIGPYLPTMVASFPEIPDAQTGLYVGLLASSFALAQLLTNFFWGYTSDRAGRKPVLLLGTGFLAACFALFGLCRAYWQVLVVHVAMGLLNGNAAVVPTVLGELTDRSNQSRAFTWLPVMYSLGGITGPALGGLLVGESATTSDGGYPFLGPNLLAAALLCVAVVVVAVWFRETLDAAEMRRPLQLRMTSVRRMCLSGSCFGRREKGKRGSGLWSHEEEEEEEDQALLDSNHSVSAAAAAETTTTTTKDDTKSCSSSSSSSYHGRTPLRQLLNWTTISILIAYLIFQVANISFNSLYPIFASAAPPTGRDLHPATIGVSMSLAGAVTIVFQVSLFEPLKARLGNMGTFRLSLLGLALGMMLMPWVGYADSAKGRVWLLVELGAILVLKNLSAVGGLSCVLLLITNSAPSHETLGTLNGIAQTLSAAGRSFGPFASGALFTLSTRIRGKGELLAWGLFGGVALVGWVMTLWIHGADLESADFMGDEDDEHGYDGERRRDEEEVA